MITKEPTTSVTGVKTYTCTICGETKTEVINKLSKSDQIITASASRSSIYVGETATITASGKGTITYTSSNTSVATVDSRGVVNGKAAGTVRITVKASGNDNYNEANTSINITVNKKEVPHTHSWNSGTVTKAASCTDAGSKTFRCSCGVTKSEVIPVLGHAYNNAYTVDIPATIDKEGSQSQHCTRCSAKANVKAIPKITSYTIYKGKTATIPRIGKATTWKTSKKKYVKVTSVGKIKGLKKGSSIISCKIDGKVYKVKVVVKDCTISVNKSKLSLKKNASFQLTAKATPDATVKWSSSKKKVATVNSNGLVTAKNKKGSCYIYVKANGVTKKIKVTVK